MKLNCKFYLESQFLFQKLRYLKTSSINIDILFFNSYIYAMCYKKNDLISQDVLMRLCRTAVKLAQI